MQSPRLRQDENRIRAALATLVNPPLSQCLAHTGRPEPLLTGQLAPREPRNGLSGG